MTESIGSKQSLESIIPTIPPTSRLVLLACLKESTALSIGRLVDLTGATPGTLLRIARKFQKQGFLVQTRNRFTHTYGLASQITI